MKYIHIGLTLETSHLIISEEKKKKKKTECIATKDTQHKRYNSSESLAYTNVNAIVFHRPNENIILTKHKMIFKDFVLYTVCIKRTMLATMIDCRIASSASSCWIFQFDQL